MSRSPGGEAVSQEEPAPGSSRGRQRAALQRPGGGAAAPAGLSSRPAAVSRPLVSASASAETPAGPSALAAAAAAPTCDRGPAPRKRKPQAGLRSVGGLRGPGGPIPNLQGTAALPGLESVNR